MSYRIIAAGLAILFSDIALGAEPGKKLPRVISQSMSFNPKAAKSAEMVLRSEKELEKKLLSSEREKLGKVDFKQSMVVAIRTGTIQYFGVKLNVEKLEVSPKGDLLTVHWKYMPYFGGAAPPPGRGNLTLTAVIPKFEGTVKFKKHVHRFKGPFPPSAPPSLPRGVSRKEDKPGATNSISLFNGKDLTGWHMDVPALDKKPDGKKPFVVRNGMLVSLGLPGGHLITDAKYQNYRLRVEYRFSGKPGNCGVLVHASKPRMLYKMFPQSIEVQMYHRNAGDFWCIGEDITVPDMIKRRGPKEKWGVTEGKARRIRNLTDGSEKKPGEWNTMIIECLGNEIKVWVNGDLVNHGTKCTARVGQIALQAEGSEVEFRKLLLTPITKLSD